ncbi:MAG: carbohydrate-binding protein [Candidatus Micrarchaeia archaeon]
MQISKRNVNELLFPSSESNFDFLSNKVNKKTSTDTLFLVSAFVLLLGTIIFFFLFLTFYFIGSLLPISLGNTLTSLGSGSELYLFLYGIVEFLIALKLFSYTIGIEHKKKIEKEYSEKMLFVFTLASIFIFIILPTGFFFGTLSSINTLPGVTYTTTLMFGNKLNFTQSNILTYTTLVDSILEFFGIAILFFSSIYYVFVNYKKYLIEVSVIFILLLLIYYIGVPYLIRQQNTYSLNNLNRLIENNTVNLNYMLDDYSLFYNSTGFNQSFYNELQNINSQQKNIDLLFNLTYSNSLWNYTTLGNTALGYGAFSYSNLYYLMENGYYITANNTVTAQLIAQDYYPELDYIYLEEDISLNKLLNLNEQSILNSYSYLISSFSKPYYFGGDYTNKGQQYIGNSTYEYSYYLEKTDYSLNKLNTMLNINPNLLYILTEENNPSNKINPMSFFYGLSLNQYYNYAIESMIYNKSISPEITYIFYGGKTLLLNLGNINPNSDSIKLYIDKKEYNFERYFNFIIVPYVNLTLGEHNITVTDSTYNLNNTGQIYVSPYLNINSEIYNVGVNSTRLDIIINNPTNRTILLSHINVNAYRNFSGQSTDISNLFVGNLIAQNLNSFKEAPKQNITLSYNISTLEDFGANYTYYVTLNSNYGNGRYLISPKIVSCCSELNIKTDATIISTTTSTTSTTTVAKTSTSNAGIGITSQETTVRQGGIAVQNQNNANNNFKTYYSLAFLGEPSFSQYNMMPAYVTGTGFNSLGEYGPGATPDIQSVYATANYVAGLNNELFSGDLEAWPIDYRSGKTQQVEDNITKFEDIVKWIHEVQPQLSVGFYGIIPLGFYTNTVGEVNYVSDPAAFQAWQNANEDLIGLVENLSYLSPNIYDSIQIPYNWTQYAIASINEGHILRKPVYPFISMYYYTEPANDMLVPSYVWALNLYVVGRYANGTIIWGGYQDPWSSTAPWWQITQNFIRSTSSTPIPQAPTNLQISNSNDPHLSWNGPSFNNNIGSFVVERSEGNENNFLPIAVVNTTSYIDNYTSSGTYYYLVKSTNWHEDSSPSNIASITTTRNALTPIYSASYSSCSNCLFWGPYVVWIGNLGSYDSFEQLESYGKNGAYLEFNNVNFSSTGVNEIVANVSLSSAIHRVSLYLQINNSDSNNTIGIFNITSTYSQNSNQVFSFESAQINKTTGTHNLYLKLMPNGSTYGFNITSIEFQNV